MMRWTAALILVILAALWWHADAACPNCRCDASVVPISFGTYNPVDPAPTHATTPVHVTCQGQSLQQTIGFNIALSAGKGSYAERQMTEGGATLRYNLYADPSHTAVWGNGTGGSTEVGGTLAVGGTKVLTVYGKIPAQQPVPAGSYLDVIVATVTY